MSEWTSVPELPKRWPVLIKSVTGHYAVAADHYPETEDEFESWVTPYDDWEVKDWPQWKYIEDYVARPGKVWTDAMEAITKDT